MDSFLFSVKIMKVNKIFIIDGNYSIEDQVKYLSRRNSPGVILI